MSDVTQLRFAQLLKRAFGVKTIDPGRTLSPSMTATFDVADPYHPEDRLSRGERLFGSNFVLTNNLGNFNITSLGNPPNSNRIVVLERVRWSGTLPTTTTQPGRLALFLQSFVGNPNIVSQCIPKDLRLGIAGTQTTLAAGINGPTNVITQPTPYAVVIWLHELSLGAAVAPFFVDTGQVHIVLPPNSALTIGSSSTVAGTASYSYSVNIEGYERIAEPSELLPAPP